MKKVFLSMLMLTVSLLSATAQDFKFRSVYDVNQDDTVDISDVTLLVSRLVDGVATERTTMDTQTLMELLYYLDMRLTAIEAKLGMIDTTDVDPVVEDEHEYVDLGLPSGTLWATCNVGADTPEGYGDYFAWGETESRLPSQFNSYTNKLYNLSTETWTKYCPSNTDRYNKYDIDERVLLEEEDDAATVNWGINWAMPTEDQMTELMTECSWTWTSQNGVRGQLVTSPSNGNSIFLPAAGYGNQGLGDTGVAGNYWTNTVYRKIPWKAYSLGFWKTDVYVTYYGRYYGYSVRPVRR